MKTYKLSDIKKVCEIICGKPIGNSTWRRWKNKLQFNPYEKAVSQAKMEQLLTLANMKRENPHQPLVLAEIIKNKSETLETLNSCEYSYKLHLLPDECKGSEFKELVYMVTGRKVHRNSLYRWGLKVQIPFSTNRIYKKDEVYRFISEIL